MTGIGSLLLVLHPDDQGSVACCEVEGGKVGGGLGGGRDDGGACEVVARARADKEQAWGVLLRCLTPVGRTMRVDRIAYQMGNGHTGAWRAAEYAKGHSNTQGWEGSSWLWVRQRSPFPWSKGDLQVQQRARTGMQS